MTVHELIRRGLFGDEDDQHQGVAMIPDPKTDTARREDHKVDYSFAQEVIREGPTLSLPKVSMDFPEAVRELVKTVDADRLYIVPPFGSSLQFPDEVRDALRDEFGHVILPIITLLAVLEALGEKRKAAFGLLSSIFRGRHGSRFREESLSLAHPELIIEPSRNSTGNSPIQLLQTIIYSGNPPAEGQTPVTRFFSFPDSSDVSKEGVADDFEQLHRQEGGETKYGFVIRDTLDPRQSWNYESYHPSLQRKIDEVEQIGELWPLSDLFDIKIAHIPGLLSGKSVPPSNFYEDDKYHGEVPIVGPKDIRSDGSIAFSDTQFAIKKDDIQQAFVLELSDEDICLRRIINSKQAVVAGKVEEHMTPLVASRHIVVLRPRKNATPEDRHVTLQYLQSETAARYLRARGDSLGSDVHLSVRLLREMPVPMADKDLQNALRSLTEAADQFDEWKSKALDAARSLFNFPTTGDGKMHVLSTGRRTRQRLQAGKRQDDLSFRVQTQFPHPVAYRWRTVAAAKPDLEGYLHVLECAEVLSCYLALVAITMARHSGVKIGYLGGLGNRVKAGRGTNLGDWIAILREVRDNKSFRQLPDGTPFYEVMHFMPAGGDADLALSSLKASRDNQAHGKGPRGDAVELAFQEAKADLLCFLDAAEFLSEYSLRYIDRTKSDTIQNRLTYWYRDVMGDHPLVPVEHENIYLKTLEAESLYLVDRSGALHLLRPLLDRRRCPVCGTWSTFYLDSYIEDDHSCVMKSMEHSHVTSDAEIYQAFQEVGLLP